MVAALAEALPSVIRRDGSTRAILNQKLAAHLRCDPARLQALHGASQIFPILKRMAGTQVATIQIDTAKIDVSGLETKK